MMIISIIYTIFWEHGCNITWWIYLYTIYYILYFNITLYLTIFLWVWIGIQWCILFQNLNKGVFCILYSEWVHKVPESEFKCKLSSVFWVQMYFMYFIFKNLTTLIFTNTLYWIFKLKMYWTTWKLHLQHDAIKKVQNQIVLDLYSSRWYLFCSGSTLQLNLGSIIYTTKTLKLAFLV